MGSFIIFQRPFLSDKIPRPQSAYDTLNAIINVLLKNG